MKYIAVNVALDSFAAIILFTLSAYLLAPSNRKIRLNRTFALICLSNLAMLLGDIPSWLSMGVDTPFGAVVLWASCLLQYAGGVAVPLAYTYYVVSYLAPKVRVNRRVIGVVAFLGALGAVCVALNLWNGMYYWIDARNDYHRGDWWWLSQIIALLTLVIDAGIVICYRSYLQRKDIRAFLGYNILPWTAIAIQGYAYGLALTYAATTVSILIIFLNIQSEQALRLEQKEKELTESRVEIMLSQIQPHFLYNALTAIRQLCRADPEQASEAVGEFARFLQGNMNSLGQKTPIPFAQELLHVQSYLALEQRRFQSRLSVVYEIEAMDFELPALSIQPIVENAIRHGLAPRREGGVVTIRSEETADAWRVIVSDNGAGFDPSALPSRERPHIGIENVRQRLAALCGGTLEIRGEPGKGTIAVLSVPKGGQDT